MGRTAATPLLSNRLRQWRVDQGFTVNELAELVGLSTAMISRVERGQRGLSPKAKVQIARRLGVRVADLFEVEPLDEDQSR